MLQCRSMERCYRLQPNAAYFVKAVTAGSLAYTEANKTILGSNLFKTTNAGNYALLHIYDVATSTSWDQLYVSLNQQAANSVDNYDADKLYNSHMDFYSYSADSQRLSIDARPFDPNGIIPLGIATDVQQDYILKTKSLTCQTAPV